MWGFYWDALRELPFVLWDAILTVEGVIAGILLLVILFNPTIAKKKKMNWGSISRKWLWLVIGLFVGYSILANNYKIHESAMQANRDLHGQLEDAENEIEQWKAIGKDDNIFVQPEEPPCDAKLEGYMWVDTSTDSRNVAWCLKGTQGYQWYQTMSTD